MIDERIVSFVWLVPIDAHYLLGHHVPWLELGLLQVLLHSFPEDGLECFECLVLIVLFEEVSELGYFLALLAAGYHLNAVDLEADDLVGLVVLLGTHQVALESILVRLLLLAQLLAAQFVVALHESALALVALHFLDGASDAANAAGDLVLRIDLHYYLRWLLHQPIVAAWALVAIPLAAKGAKQLAALLSVRALPRLVENLLANATDEVFVHVFERGTTQAQDVEALLRVDLDRFLSAQSTLISLR